MFVLINKGQQTSKWIMPTSFS